MDFNDPDSVPISSYGETGSAKKRIAVMAILVGILLVIILAVMVTTRIFFKDSERPTNLIIMLADGFGPAQLSLARLAKPGGVLALDSLLIGHISTRSANSIVTDSAAGATAYSCGLKTNNYAVAVKPDGSACATLLEASKNAKMKTGIVVTSEITHATPAAFATHAADRSDYSLISHQLINKGIDVIFGGGLDIITSNGLWETALSQYSHNVITTKEKLSSATSSPILGIFANSHLNYTIDKNETQPSLVEMTSKALELLRNNKGFFLLVEGSRIDHASHENDPAAMVQEVIAFDETVKAVVDFAETEQNTIVVIVSDHETGGLTIGKNGLYEYNIEALKSINHSISWMIKNMSSITQYNGNRVSNPFTKDIIVDYIKNYTSLFTSGDDSYFANVTNSATARSALIQYIGDKTLTGWTTSAHTGVDIPLFAYGLGITHFLGKGTLENQFVGQTIAEFMGFNLEALTKKFETEAKRTDTSGITQNDEYHTR